VLHYAELPVPVPPIAGEGSDTGSEDEELGDADWKHDNTSKSSAPHFLNQTELDDLVRDLGLTKSGAELLTSRLKEWNLLDSSCKVSVYRSRHVQFSRFYTMDDSLCYCCDVSGLFEAIGIHISINNSLKVMDK